MDSGIHLEIPTCASVVYFPDWRSKLAMGPVDSWTLLHRGLFPHQTGCSLNQTHLDSLSEVLLQGSDLFEQPFVSLPLKRGQMGSRWCYCTRHWDLPLDW